MCKYNVKCSILLSTCVRYCSKLKLQKSKKKPEKVPHYMSVCHIKTHKKSGTHTKQYVYINTIHRY